MFTSLETINLINSEVPKLDKTMCRRLREIEEKFDSIEGVSLVKAGMGNDPESDSRFRYFLSFLSTKEGFDVIMNAYSELLQVISDPEDVYLSIQQKPVLFKVDNRVIYQGIESVVRIVYHIKEETETEAILELEKFFCAVLHSVLVACSDITKTEALDRVIQKLKGNPNVH